MDKTTGLPISTPHRTYEGIKSTPKVTFSWTTTNLVFEAMDVNLHALEDCRMISWLGRQNFVELCINNTGG